LKTVYRSGVVNNLTCDVCTYYLISAQSLMAIKI